MARFNLELPQDIIKDVEKINSNAEKIFSGMVQAGAEVVQNNIEANAPIPELRSRVKVSKTYKTPSDDGINAKVYVGGYIPFKGNRKSVTIPAKGKQYTNKKGVPAGFVAMMYEYGSSGERTTTDGENRGVFPKRPFVRKSFRKAQIEKAMLKAQKELSGGLLDE